MCRSVRITFFPTDRITFNAIQSKLLRLIEEVRSDRFGRDAQIPLYVNDLLLYLNRLVYERLHPQKSRTEESLYQNVAAYIEEHLDEDLSLEKLAGEFFVSKYHIAHVFKDNLGLSIHQYITKKTACPLQGSHSRTNEYHRSLSDLRLR